MFFSNGNIRNVVAMLPNVVKIDVEHDNVAWTLSNVVQFNVEIHNVVSILLNVVNYVDEHKNNVEPTLQPKNNVEPTLKCFWNVNKRPRWDPFSKYITVLPTNHYHKSLNVTCFRGSVILLWYLFILLFLYH